MKISCSSSGFTHEDSQKAMIIFTQNRGNSICVARVGRLGQMPKAPMQKRRRDEGATKK